MKLKRCPCCGSKSAVRIVPDTSSGGFYVICDYLLKGCGTASGWRSTEEEVRAAWNKRHKNEWIEWRSSRQGEMPVPRGTLVDVKFRDKAKAHGVPAGMSDRRLKRDAADRFWHTDGFKNDIVKYRLSKTLKT